MILEFKAESVSDAIITIEHWMSGGVIPYHRKWLVRKNTNRPGYYIARKLGK